MVCLLWPGSCSFAVLQNALVGGKVMLYLHMKEHGELDMYCVSRFLSVGNVCMLICCIMYVCDVSLVLGGTSITIHGTGFFLMKLAVSYGIHSK